MAFFNIHTLTLSFICFLLSWSSSISPSLSPPSSTHAAANALRNRGYSLFASTTKNFSGTILAPPDFIFSKVLPPSPILLRYHTLNTPITWAHLLSYPNGTDIQTQYKSKCLFFFKTSNGEISISSNKNSLGVVRIRQPDIYVDDHLTVHGIDGVLEPTSATQCSVPRQSQEDHRSFLDHAIKALRRRRFTVAATALTIKRQELLSLTSLSVFAPSDMALFSRPDGFRYDYRHHVVPQRYRFGDLERNIKGIMVFETLDSNKTLVVNFVDGFITVNGVIVNSTEVYINRWIVVLSVWISLDDAANFIDSGSFAPSPAPSTMEIRHSDEVINGINASVQTPAPATVEIHYPDKITNGLNASFQSPAPANMEIHHPNERINASIAGVQSPETMDIRHPDEIINATVQSPAPVTMDIRHPDERINGSTTSVQSPSPATVESNVNDIRCVFGIEGGDLLCPASGPRERHLQEEEDLIDDLVAHYAPSDVKDQLAEGVNQSLPLISSAESGSVGKEHSRMNIIDQDHLNIADDLFFYF